LLSEGYRFSGRGRFQNEQTETRDRVALPFAFQIPKLSTLQASTFRQLFNYIIINLIKIFSPTVCAQKENRFYVNPWKKINKAPRARVSIQSGLSSRNHSPYYINLFFMPIVCKRETPKQTLNKINKYFHIKRRV
jgi:hypothetical protein